MYKIYKVPDPKLSKAFGILSTDFSTVWIEPPKKLMLSNSTMKRQCKLRVPGFLPPAVDKAEQLQQQDSFIAIIKVTAHVLFPFGP